LLIVYSCRFTVYAEGPKGTPSEHPFGTVGFTINKINNMKRFLASISMVIGLFVIFIGLNGCSDEFFNCVKGNGKIYTEPRSLLPFETVSVNGDFDVYVEQDTVTDVRVEGDENLVPYILTRVNGSNLTIKVKDNRCLKETQQVKIYLKSPNIRELNMSGSGMIKTTDTLKSDNIDLSISGSGDIKALVNSQSVTATISGSGNIDLFGSTGTSDFKISGSGKIRSMDMGQNSCYINISGSGSIYTNVLKSMDVYISGSGTVYYIGSPVINRHISGSGEIIKL
jgi:hypothetical protein